MIHIALRFGDPEDDARGQTEQVSFETREEANAFMMGIEMANGWMSYDVLRDGRQEEADYQAHIAKLDEDARFQDEGPDWGDDDEDEEEEERGY